jgi:hypothetical protein
MAERPSPVLRERIRAAVHARAAPTRSFARARATTIHVAYALALTAALGAMLARSASLRAATITLRIVASLVFAALTATGLTAPTHGTSVLGRRDEELAVAFGAAPTVFLIAFQEYGASAEPFAPSWWPCAAATSFAFVLLYAFALRARRGLVPHRPALHGGALAGAMALWASALAFAICPSRAPEHLALGHVGPIVALVLGGALAGRSVLAVRVR